MIVEVINFYPAASEESFAPKAVPSKGVPMKLKCFQEGESSEEENGRTSEVPGCGLQNPSSDGSYEAPGCGHRHPSSDGRYEASGCSKAPDEEELITISSDEEVDGISSEDEVGDQLIVELISDDYEDGDVSKTISNLANETVGEASKSGPKKNNSEEPDLSTLQIPETQQSSYYQCIV